MLPDCHPFGSVRPSSGRLAEMLAEYHATNRPRLSFSGLTTEEVPGRRTGIYTLRRLMYISRAVDPARLTVAGLQLLALKSKVANERDQITGFLIHTAPYFIQVIEGPPSAIGDLYQRLLDDPRHTSLTVVMDISCVSRLYAQWNMQLVVYDPHQAPAAVISVLHTISSGFLTMWAYLPKNAATLLLAARDPSKEPPLALPSVVMFLHILEFDSMLHNDHLLPFLPELLTAFMDLCVRRIESSDGQVAKFMNGTCMAYWPDVHAAEAIEAVQHILSDLDTLRTQHSGSPLGLLHAVAGLHCGTALLCNAGTKRSDFTLLGDCINTCSRLANLAKKLQTQVLLSADVVDQLLPGLFDLESVGVHSVHGRNQPVRCHCFPNRLLDVVAVQNAIAAFGVEGEGGSFQLPLQCDMIVHADTFMYSDSFPTSPNSAALRSSRLPMEQEEEVSLTYVSRAPEGLPRATLAAIQRASDCRNKEAGITSCLLYLNGLIAQTLEGPLSAVFALVDRIRGDMRHTDMVVVHAVVVSRRAYEQPLRMVVLTEHSMEGCCAVHDVLTQLARSFISLETYVPAAVVRHVMGGEDPRQLPPLAMDVVMLATDICAFTTVSEAFSLTGVWELCTAFIDCCTEAIAAGGGETLKLIGDCVTAYFPPAAAAAAVEVARAIVRGCTQVRTLYHGTADCRAVLYCGVGLDAGPVTVAHVGSERSMEVALIGEVGLRVFDVEAQTRVMGRAIVLTEAVVSYLPTDIQSLQLLPATPALLDVHTYGLLGHEWSLNAVTVRWHIDEQRETQAQGSGDARSNFCSFSVMGTSPYGCVSKAPEMCETVPESLVPSRPSASLLPAMEKTLPPLSTAATKVPPSPSDTARTVSSLAPLRRRRGFPRWLLCFTPTCRGPAH
eukprot:GGOE01026611.1.p1 GENE.GGOE01026611.1~~GGOE01026611.1.p1  ORF type:complete len:894 (+),score=242.66 GGOE01026611.1:64-2745(+)